MRRLLLLACLAAFCAAPAHAGFSLGRPGAVKKRVEKLDDKVRAARAAAAAQGSGNGAPVVASLTAVSTTVAAGGLARLTVSASDPDGDSLSYVWSSTAGTLSGTGTSVYWLAPSTPGVYTVSCVVSDGTDSAPGTRQVAAVHPGTLKWVFTPSAVVDLPPAAAADGTLYAAASDGVLYAVGQDGVQDWAFTTENNDLFDFGPVSGSDGTVYVVAASTKTYAVTASGSSKWGGPSPLFPSNITDPPVLGTDGTLYLYNGDAPELYALSVLTGAGVSTFTALTGIARPPVVGADGTIYVVDGSDMLYMVPPADGLARSTSTDVSGISSQLAPGPDGIVFLPKDNYDLYAFNPDGTQKWGPYNMPDVVAEAPVVGADGAAYIYDATPAIHRVSSTTGAGSAFGSLAALSNTPVPGPDSLMYLVDDGTDIYAMNPDGSVKWGPLTVPDGAALSSDPVFSRDGTLFFCTDDGKIYAVYATSSLP